MGMDPLFQKYDKTPKKVDLRELKNLHICLNDFIIEYMNLKGYKENHRNTDIKIVIGFVSTILASIACFLSVKYDFSWYRYYMYIIVGLYFTLNGGVAFLDSNTFYRGNKKDSNHSKSIQIENISIPGENTYTINFLFDRKRRKFIVDIKDVFYKNGEFDHKILIEKLEKLEYLN